MACVLDHTAVIAESDMQSSSNERNRSISPPLRSPSNSGIDSSDVEGTERRSRPIMENKKGRRGRGCRQYCSDEFKCKLQKKRRDSLQSSDDARGHKSKTSTKDARSSSEEGIDRCGTRTRNTEEKLRMIFQSTIASKRQSIFGLIVWRTPHLNTTGRCHVAKMAKRMTAKTSYI